MTATSTLVKIEGKNLKLFGMLVFRQVMIAGRRGGKLKNHF
jgi:hypothetical protein